MLCNNDRLSIRLGAVYLVGFLRARALKFCAVAKQSRGPCLRRVRKALFALHFLYRAATAFHLQQFYNCAADGVLQNCCSYQPYKAAACARPAVHSCSKYRVRLFKRGTQESSVQAAERRCAKTQPRIPAVKGNGSNQRPASSLGALLRPCLLGTVLVQAIPMRSGAWAHGHAITQSGLNRGGRPQGLPYRSPHWAVSHP